MKPLRHKDKPEMKNPVGLAYTAGLPADTARPLQTAAWDTVQAYARP